jgi:hypothetical protein
VSGPEQERPPATFSRWWLFDRGVVAIGLNQSYRFFERQLASDNGTTDSCDGQGTLYRRKIDRKHSNEAHQARGCYCHNRNRSSNLPGVQADADGGAGSRAQHEQSSRRRVGTRFSGHRISRQQTGRLAQNRSW